jgi:uncharacterized membrane protein
MNMLEPLLRAYNAYFGDRGHISQEKQRKNFYIWLKVRNRMTEQPHLRYGFLIALLLISALLSILPFAQAATISGTVYDYSLSPARGAFVTVNTMPKQQYVAANATYSFYVPLGKYNITATFDSGSLEYYSIESVIVTGNEEYVLDIVLLPLTDDRDNLSDLPIYEYEPMFTQQNGLDAGLLLMGFTAGVVLLLAGIVVYKVLDRLKVLDKASRRSQPAADAGEKKGRAGHVNSRVRRIDLSARDKGQAGKIAGLAANKMHSVRDMRPEVGTILDEKAVAVEDAAGLAISAEQEKQEAPAPIDEGPESEILDMIRNNRRLTQKDIRRKIPYSEAKISLVLSDLEAQGIIRKIRKGRGNIIVYCGKPQAL